MRVLCVCMYDKLFVGARLCALSISLCEWSWLRALVSRCLNKYVVKLCFCFASCCRDFARILRAHELAPRWRAPRCLFCVLRTAAYLYKSRGSRLCDSLLWYFSYVLYSCRAWLCFVLTTYKLAHLLIKLFLFRMNNMRTVCIPLSSTWYCAHIYMII